MLQVFWLSKSLQKVSKRNATSHIAVISVDPGFIFILAILLFLIDININIIIASNFL
jgi:hypothetical protein